MAALMCAPGRIGSDHDPAGHDMYKKLNPHEKYDQEPDSESGRPPPDLVRSNVDGGMKDTGQHEQPGQYQHDQVGTLGYKSEGYDGVEQHRQFELIRVVGRPLKGILRPDRLAP